MAQTLFLFLFVLAVVYGAIRDVTSFTIPNAVCYGIALLFIPFAALSWSATPVLLHVILGVAVTAICIAFWKLRWFGGGDAKFVGAISFWMGPYNIVIFSLLLAVISVVLIGALRLLRQWNFVIQQGRFPAFVKHLLNKAEEGAIPYGLPAAAAALITLLPGYMR